MNKKIFIHIPKNGGMTIRKTPEIKDKIILAGKDKHISERYTAELTKTMKMYHEHHGYEHSRWRDIHPKYTNKYDAFAIIRNPWSKVISRYTFAQWTKEIPKRTSVEEFLEQRHTYGNIPYFWHRAIKGWYQQVDYVTDIDDVLQCDILRLEMFDEDVNKYFNMNITFHVRNVSNGEKINNKSKVGNQKDYRSFFNDTTKEIVADWYQKDIEFFGFAFDGPATKNIWNKG